MLQLKAAAQNYLDGLTASDEFFRQVIDILVRETPDMKNIDPAFINALAEQLAAWES